MHRSWPILPALLLALPLHAQDTAPAAMPPVSSASAVTWSPGPPFLPAGARMAVLDGNPAGSGGFTVRLSFPNGYRVPPHWHPADEHVTVISGTLMLGMGDEIDRASATRIGTGGFVTAPAKAHHYALAAGPTVVQIHGTGPFEITYVRPEDDPRTAKP